MRHIFIYKSMSLFLLILLLYVGTAFSKYLYDDFSARYIDDSKWSESELVREVSNGNLILKTGNHIVYRFAQNDTNIRNPSAIHAIECDVAVDEIVLDSGTTPLSGAGVGGFWYNSQGSGNATGDIHAVIYFGDKGDGLEVFWIVDEMLTDDLYYRDIKGSGVIAVPDLEYGQKVTLKIQYDGSNRFTFTANGLIDQFIGPNRKGAAVTQEKGLTTKVQSGDGNGKGYIFAKFDNVSINNQKVLYDTFDAPLDPNRWDSDEEVSEISNGTFRLNRQGSDEQSQITQNLYTPGASLVEVEARFESETQLSLGARCLIRIQGIFYNDSRGPGSGQDYNGYEGDIFASVRLEMEDDRSPKARALVLRFDDSDPNSYSYLLNELFLTSINIDTFYTISIEYKNSELIFKCNDEALIYTVGTSEYPAFEEHRALRSRLYLDPGESGYVKATIDEVYIEGDEIDDDHDGDGFHEEHGDCNDNDNSIYPEAPEICEDGIDQDCNGSDLVCENGGNDDRNGGSGFCFIEISCKQPVKITNN